MSLNIHFSNPFTRSQLRTQLSTIVTNNPTLTFSVTAAPISDDIADTPTSEDQGIIALTVGGFADIQAVGTFLESLPAAAEGRYTEVSYQP